MEIVNVIHKEKEKDIENISLLKSKLLVDESTLKENETILEEINQLLCKNYRELKIETKHTYTTKHKFLAGITIDGRNLDNWNIFFKYKEKILKEIRSFKKQYDIKENELMIQTYKKHPFLDIYACYCSKSMAYDNILNMLKTSNNKKILYFGDSENDNSVFKKVDISIGISSDTRLNPQLECKYLLKYQDLSNFLSQLKLNNFNFFESLLTNNDKNN